MKASALPKIIALPAILLMLGMANSAQAQSTCTAFQPVLNTGLGGTASGHAGSGSTPNWSASGSGSDGWNRNTTGAVMLIDDNGGTTVTVPTAADTLSQTINGVAPSSTINLTMAWGNGGSLSQVRNGNRLRLQLIYNGVVYAEFYTSNFGPLLTYPVPLPEPTAGATYGGLNGATVTVASGSWAPGVDTSFVVTLPAGIAASGALTFSAQRIENGVGATSGATDDIYLTDVSVDTTTLCLVKTTVGGTGTFGFTMGSAFDSNVDTAGVQSAATIATSAINTGVAYDASAAIAGVQPMLVVSPGTATGATITESTLPASFSLTGATCDNGVTAGVSGATVTLGAIPARADVTCTLTNTKKATLRIQKSRVGSAGAPLTFNFTGNGPGSGLPGDDSFAFLLSTTSALTHDYGTANANTVTPGTTELNNLTPGTYTITEAFTDAASNDFELTNVSCANQAGGVTGSTVSSTIGGNGGSATIDLVPGANYLCTFVNTRDPHIVLTKQVQGAGGIAFTYNVTATGTGTVTPANPVSLTPPTNGTAQTDIDVQLPGGTPRSVTITENALPAGYILVSASCTKITTAAGGSQTTTNYPGVLATRSVTISGFGVDDSASCTFVNAQQPTVVIRKQSLGDTGSFTFISGTNGLPASVTLSTATLNPSPSVAYPITVPGASASITETVPAGWTLTGASCVDGASTPVSTSISGSTLTISGGATTGGATLTCTFVNTRNAAQVSLSKSWSGAVVNDTAALSATGGATNPTLSSTANSANEIDVGSPVAVPSGTVLTLSEILGAGNAGLYNASAWNCTGTAGLTGNTLTVGNGDTSIVCTIINARQQVNLSIAKTNTPGSGAFDQTDDTLVSGTTTTYTIVITNDGPDGAVNAVFRDPAPTGVTVTGVSCGSPTGGATCPAPGAVTVASMQSASGILIPSIPNGGAVTFTVVGTVQ